MPRAASKLMRHFNDWWGPLTLKGDPMRRPNLTQEAFEAGYRAALDDAARIVENEPVDLMRHTSPDALCMRDEEMARMIRTLP